MRKFEAHITMPREQGQLVEQMAASLLGKFSYSAIDGDPVMGKRPYCYLTAYDTDGLRLLETVRFASLNLRSAGIDVLREKVEEIVYDSKTGHDTLTNGTL